MKAVIPCAKKKETLFPLSETKPTGLMPIAEKTIIDHLISSLEDVGVDEVYLVTNYKEEDFRQEYDDQPNITIVHQEELNGTAGAIETCDFIKDDFLVVNGDVITSTEDLDALIEKHESSDSSTTILATDNEKPEKFGVLSIRDDKVLEIVEKPEKPENNLINTGIYVFSPSIIENIRNLEEDETSITDAVSRILENEEVQFQLVKNYWSDIGTLNKLWKSDKTKRESNITKTKIHKDAIIHNNVEITGKTTIEDGAEIKPGTVLEGRNYIGEDAVIGPNTVIKDSTINKNCLIRNAEIDNSLLFEDTIIDPFVYVENSIIGEKTDIKSGTIIRECKIGAQSFIDMNNSIRGVKFVPNARTDLSEISK